MEDGTKVPVGSRRVDTGYWQWYFPPYQIMEKGTTVPTAYSVE